MNLEQVSIILSVPFVRMASIKQTLGEFKEAVDEYLAILQQSPSYVPALKGNLCISFCRFIFIFTSSNNIFVPLKNIKSHSPSRTMKHIKKIYWPKAGIVLLYNCSSLQVAYPHMALTSSFFFSCYFFAIYFCPKDQTCENKILTICCPGTYTCVL